MAAARLFVSPVKSLPPPGLFYSDSDGDSLGVAVLYSDSSPLGVWQYRTTAATDWQELAFPAAAQSAIWRVLAAVLHLGNVTFKAGEKEGTQVR